MKKHYIYSSATGLLILTFFQFLTLSPSDSKLRVYFLDVGQGDSALIRYPTGEHLLIDTGKDSKVFRSLDKVLPWYNKTIDYVLLTHGDLDHVGAMMDILDRYKVKKVFVSEFFGKIEVEQTILKRLEEEHAIVEVLKLGDTFTFGTQIQNSFKIINPDSNCFETYKNENDCSLVGLLTYGDTTFLFTGDISSAIESTITKYISMSIDVLKVAHHGSKYSSDQSFLQKIKPKYALISVGENKYGHPAPDVITRLQAASSTVWSTKEAATIVAASNGTSVEVKKLFDQARFFQSSVCSVLLYSFETPC
jgi:beta-lactamase superfamily II metal-dependent hydrolase